MRGIFFDEDDARSAVARLVASGYDARVERERLSGEDDDEGHPWAVLTDAPELVLSRLLDEYRTAREERFASTSGRAQGAAGLLVVGLQQRLLSCIEAFARSLKVHRATGERDRDKGRAAVATMSSVEPETLDIERQLAGGQPRSAHERGGPRHRRGG